jgi:hypothetical protein
MAELLQQFDDLAEFCSLETQSLLAMLRTAGNY